MFFVNSLLLCGTFYVASSWRRGLAIDRRLHKRVRAVISKLLAPKDEALLLLWDASFILDLTLGMVDRISALDLECHSLACYVLDEDLYVLIWGSVLDLGLCLEGVGCRH